MVDGSVDPLSALRGLGLSVYESRAYLTLLRKGVCSARDVASVSRVPQAKVYSVLEQLVSKGFAMKKPTRPASFSAVDFGIVVERTKESFEKKLSVAQSSLKKDTSRFHKDFLDESLWIVEGERGVKGEMKRIMRSAEKSLYIMTTGGIVSSTFRGEFWLTVNFLKDISDRGIDLRVIADFDKRSMRTFYDAASDDLKATIEKSMKRYSPIPARIVLRDEREGIAVAEDEKSLYSRGYVFSGPICSFIVYGFNSAWKNVPPIKSSI